MDPIDAAVPAAASDQDWRIGLDSQGRIAKPQVAELANKQFGRVTRAQLLQLGAGHTAVDGWIRAGYLFRRLPGVYAVGSAARTTESDLFEAVLYAGPGAVLSHASAAHWYGIADHRPNRIHVSTPRRRQSPPRIAVHGRRVVEREQWKGMPVTTIARTVLDLAADPGDPKQVRRALSILDYRRKLDLDRLLALCVKGQKGAALLRQTIFAYDPLMARAKSDVEIDWVAICRRTGSPEPDALNAKVCGIESDNVYYDPKLIVELDGAGNHRSRAQVHRDRQNDFIRRAAGWMVVRYSGEQVLAHSDAVMTEFCVLAAERAGRGSRPRGAGS